MECDSMKFIEKHSLIVSKEELEELFLKNRIVEVDYCWLFDNKRVDILAFDSKELNEKENFHKTNKYKIVYKLE